MKRVFFIIGRISGRVSRTRWGRYVGFWRHFYRMRRLGVPVLTLRMAQRRGIRNIYHLNKGVGDGLMFAGVAREFYKRTGQRPLLYLPQWYLLQNCDFCYFLWDWRMQPHNVANTSHTMDAFYYLYMNQMRGKPLMGRRGYTFNLCPTAYLKDVYVCGNTFEKFYCGFPMRGTAVQWVANRMGLMGDIDTKPEIRLSQSELEFGKFAKGKIVVKCGGNTAYKYLNAKIIQGIIDALKDEYEFLQVGDFEDPQLNGVENLFKLNFRQFGAVLSHARMFIGPISGLMHLARAVNCPAVIFHGCEHDDFYYPSQCKIFAENPCQFCAHRCWWPDGDDERRCPNKHRCIQDFEQKRVLKIIREQLKRPREDAAMPDIVKCVGRVVDCRTAMNWWMNLDDYITNSETPVASDECRVNALDADYDYTTEKSDKYSITGAWTDVEWKRKRIAKMASCGTWETASDNPFIIRMMPRPSCFSYIANIAALQVQWTQEWHDAEPEDDTPYWKNEAKPAPKYETLIGFARANHLMNFSLWHTEDIARRTDVDDSVIADAKRKIDRFNQWRNDFMEKMDETVLQILAPDLPGNLKAPMNSETVGMILDRLSILALKIYHMKEAAQKPENRKRCTEKLQVLETQRKDLLIAISELFTDYLSGARRPRVYYQQKMYNDPKLNPQLAGNGNKKK